MTRIAAAALALSAGVHVTQAFTHAGQGPEHAATFAAFAALQVSVAVALLFRPTAVTTLIGAGVALAGAAAWVASRTIGLPLLGREPAGILDTATAALGVLAAVALLPAGPVRRLRVAAVPGVTVLALAVAIGGVAGLTAPSSHVAHAATDGIHLHGLGTDEVDPGPDPASRSTAPLDATLVSTGRLPSAVVLDAGAAYVAARGDGTVARIDRATRRQRTFDLGGEPAVLARAFGSLWVGRNDGDVLRIDPRTGETLARIPVTLPTGITAGDGMLWVAEGTDGLVLAIDPRLDRVVERIPVGFGPTGLMMTEHGLYVVNTLDRQVVRIEDGRITATIDVGGGASGIAQAGGALWVAAASEGAVYRIDPARARITAVVPVDDRSLPGRGPVALAATDGAIWVLNNHDRTVVRIDTNSNRPGRPLLLSNAVAPAIVPGSIAASHGEVWATDAAGDAVAILAEAGR